MNELALFAGAGGGILGGILLGWRTVCAVEIDPYCRKVLLQRQRDGMLEPFPIWDDVRTFDGKPWRGLVDIVTGGFPCQDISAGNPKAEGISGARSGLWSEMARIVSEVRPHHVFVENSPLLIHRGLAVVLTDLAEMGYDAKWGIVGAHHVGAVHKRERCFLYAHLNENNDIGKTEPNGNWPDIDFRFRLHSKNGKDWKSWFSDLASMDVVQWSNSYTESRGVFYGMAFGLDRLGALGNGQVPAVVRLAWKLLTSRLT